VNAAPPAAYLPAADVILSAFGPQRIMVGSDWPVCLLAADYAAVIELAKSLVAGLSEVERTAVFSSTAAGVYRMGGPVRAAHGAGGGTWLLPTRRSRRSSR
jgi:L-fuconolactonase